MLPILNPTPIEIPSVPAKVYSKLHILSLVARQPTATSGGIALELLPTTEEGDFAGPELLQRYNAPLYPTLEEVPELAAAFEAIAAAIPAVINWIQTVQAPPAPPTPTEDPTQG
jgi:hypothetical protein